MSSPVSNDFVYCDTNPPHDDMSAHSPTSMVSNETLACYSMVDTLQIPSAFPRLLSSLHPLHMFLCCLKKTNKVTKINKCPRPWAWTSLRNKPSQELTLRWQILLPRQSRGNLNSLCGAPAEPRTLLQLSAWNVCVLHAFCSCSSVPCPNELLHQRLSAHLTVATLVTLRSASRFLISISKVNEISFPRPLP